MAINEIKEKRIPNHVALIMDGNGRWAKKRGLPRTEGHKEGANRVRDVIDACIDLKIPYVSFFAFSTENWQRPQEEVNVLMDILSQALDKYTTEAIKKQIKLIVLGDASRLPKHVRDRLLKVQEKTRNFNRLTVILALNYSGRWDILEGVKNFALHIKKNPDFSLETLNEQVFRSFMPGGNIPDPDLLIRTSGELRISNFYLWQLAYTELYFTPVFWPEFSREEFLKALADWQRRERRFGKISEQITSDE